MTGLPLDGDNEMPESYFSRVLFLLSFLDLLHTMKGTNQSFFRQRTVHTMLTRERLLVELLPKKASDERTASGVTAQGSVDTGKPGASSAVTKESAERAAKLAMTDDLVSSTIVSNSVMALLQMSKSKRDRIDRMMKQQEKHAIDSPFIHRNTR
jgi:hypothetical protein